MSAPRSRNTVNVSSRARRQTALRRASKPVFEGLENRQMLAVNPVMVYNFNEGSGTTVADTGTGDAVANNGSLVASPSGVEPYWGASTASPAGGGYLTFPGDMAINGQGGRVDLLNNLAPVLGNNSTIAYYVRTTATAPEGADAIWQTAAVTGAEQAGGNANDVFYGSLTTTGQVRSQAGDGASAVSPGPINDGEWHLVAHTYDAATGQMRTYVDGVLRSSVTTATGPKTAAFQSLGALTNRNTALDLIEGYNYFSGDLDQVQIYDRVLAPEEVAALMPAGAVPAAPAVTASTPIARAVNLTFADVPDALGYLISRSTTGAPGSYTQVAVVAPDATAGGTTVYSDRNLTAGQQYFYQVVAYGQGGSSAPASANATASAIGNGLSAHYYNNGFWGNGGRPVDANNISVGSDAAVNVVVGNEINFDYGNGSPNAAIRNDNFSTAWTGKIVAPETGNYYILGFGDDDTHVFVNGTLVSSDPNGHGIPANTATGIGEIDTRNLIALQQGQAYDIVVLQAEQGSGAGVILRWLTPSMIAAGDAAAALVPVDALRTAASVPTAPTGFQAAANNGTSVNLTFTDSSTSEVRYELERSVNGGEFIFVRNLPIVQNPNDGQPASASLFDFVTAPGTYTYRLRAVNFDGSSTAVTSGPVTVTAPITVGTGAQGYYFNTEFWGTSARPADGQVIVGRTPDAPTENVGDVAENWGDNGPAGIAADPGGDANANNTFSTVFTGVITAPATGEYEILGFSDDDSYVWVNGQLTSADPGGHGVPGNVNDINIRNPITLTAGQTYNFVAVQAEGGGGAGMFLRWRLPGTTNYVDIPASAITSNIPNAAGGTSIGAPVSATNVRVEEDDRQGTWVILRWDDAATNELRYTVERTNVATGVVNRYDVPINANSFLDNGLAASTQYTYRVIASNFQGESVSTSVNVTTRAENQLPAAPNGVVTLPRANGVQVYFKDQSTTETQFVIERATVTGGVVGSFAEVGRIAGSAPSATGAFFGFRDTSAVAGTTYVYQVRALNPAGVSDPAAAAQLNFVKPTGTGVQGNYQSTINFSGDTVASPNPVDFDENFGGGGPAGVTLTNDDNRGVNESFTGRLEGYVVPQLSGPHTFHLSSDDGIALAVVDPETGAVLIDFNNLGARRGLSAAGTWSDNAGTVDLVAGKRYAIVVRVLEDGGDAGYRVGWSTPATPAEVIPAELLFQPDATAPLLAPVSLAVRPVGTDAVLTFDGNFGNLTEAGFQVLRSDSGAAGTFTVVGTTAANATRFTDTGLVAGQTYHYQVRAVRGANEFGPVSSTVSITAGTVGGPGITYNGNAKVIAGPTPAENQLQITDNVNGQTSSAFLTNARPVETAGQGPAGTNGFTTSFEFVMPEGTANTPADGFAFVIQRGGPTAIGGGGGQLGYSGIGDSLAIEFDVFDRQNEIGIYHNGTALVTQDGTGSSSSDTGLDFRNGNTYRVEIKYDGDSNAIEITITDLTTSQSYATTFFTSRGDVQWNTSTTQQDLPIDIPALIGGNQAFFGFTGATGGFNVDQRIGNWVLNGEAISFPVVEEGLVVPAGTTMTVDNIRTTKVTIGAGATLIVTANGGAAGASKVGTIVFQDGTGKINLNDNDIVITGMSAADVRNLVRSGQLTTTMTEVGGKTRALAVAAGNDPNLSTSLNGQLAGQSFTGTDTLVKYTYHGDADLDGDVDPNDVAQWGVNFTGDLPAGTGTKTWTQGDWDGDGDVDPNDVALWGVNFTGDLPPGTGLSADAPAPVAAAAPVAARPVVAPVAEQLLPAAPVTQPVITQPVATPITKPVTTPVAKPAVKPVVKPAARPVIKPAAKPAALSKAAAAAKAPALASVFSSKKIGAAKTSATSAVLGSKGGSVLK